jgi:hypothetical protein
MKSIKIKGKDYVQVNERIIFFRNAKQFEGWSYDTNVIHHDEQECIVKCIVYDANQKLMSAGHAHEFRNSSNINKTSFLENCETSAIGRALGGLAIGIDDAMASADEVQNAMLNQTKPTGRNTLTKEQYFKTLENGTKKQIEKILKDFDMTETYRKNLNAKIKQL